MLFSSRDRKYGHDPKRSSDWKSCQINRLHDVMTSAYQTVAIMYYSSDRDEMIVT